MATTAPLRLARLDPRATAELNDPVVRTVTFLALAAGAMFAIAGQVSGEEAFFVQARGAVLVGVIGGVQLTLHRAHAATLLTSAGVVIAASAIAMGPGGALAATGASMAVVGMGASLFVGRFRWGFLAGYSALILISSFAIYGDATLAISQGVLLASVFALGACVLLWLLDHTRLEGQRFTHLFTSAPVSIWEEDFSEAAAWLQSLRDTGVSDLASFLDENPELLRRAAARIKVNAVNDAAVELLEATGHEQLLGGLEPHSPAAAHALREQLLAIWTGQSQITLEIIDARTVKGNRLDGLLSWNVPISGGRPDFAHVIVAIVDVSKSREAQEQLEGLIRSKDELVATVSHEIRTPLTAVVGLSQELRDSYSLFEPDEAHDLVRLIAEQSLEVSTIVEDLLAVAQADAGKLQVTLEPVDLRHEAEITLKGLGNEHRVPLYTPRLLGTVMADPGRVRQIIRNLIVNAQRYGGSSIRIVVREDEWMAKIEVRDDGRMLPNDQWESIFSRYYRSQQSPGVTASVGLGLTVSRELARAMGGDLSYHHDGEAVFTISFPLVTAPATVLV